MKLKNNLLFILFIFIFSKAYLLDLENLEKSELKKLLLGKIDPQNFQYFVKIPPKYSIYTNLNLYIESNTLEAFIKMAKDADNNGIKLFIVSAFRSFNTQKLIWERKWEKFKIKDDLEKAKEILKYSSMPATSRHHWGTDIDINSVDDSYFKSFNGIKVYNWLLSNAGKYGFCMPYSKKRNNYGYNLEKWHWSYTNISKKMLYYYTNLISYDDIKGFYGDFLADDIDIINNYVLNIDESCK